MSYDERLIGPKKYDKRYFARFWCTADKRAFHPFYDFTTLQILKLLCSKTEKILDVGCGRGLLIGKLRQKNIDAWGMDRSPAAFYEISRTVRRFSFAGSGEAIPLVEKAYDVVVCIDVLEHIERAVLPRFIGECSRVALRAIYFSITSLENIFFIFGDPTHVSKYFSWQWHRILRDCLGDQWRVKRASFLPLIHHGMFVAERM